MNNKNVSDPFDFPYKGDRHEFIMDRLGEQYNPPAHFEHGKMENKKDYIWLKWGTLKRWKITSDKGRELLKKYDEIGSTASAMMQRDTPEQKQIICDLIDTVPGKIYLVWDGKWVSKSKAKQYVLDYK